MLSFSPIEKPKIDIELYGTDINIAPIDKVHIMDEDSFEHFTLEWLYGCSTSEGIQTIVIENEIPEIDYSNVNLIHFTKNANTGRYGFLIDVMD